MSKAKLAIALSTLSVALVAWAVPIRGIAHQRVQQLRGADVVAPVRLKDERERGLLAQGWINGAGPFVFVIDTGAGVSLISRNVVAQSRLAVTRSRRTLVGGLSTSPIASNEETRVSGLALGQRGNNVPGSFSAAVVANLPGSIDGILDPTDVFRPYGYSVDIPNRELRVFDTAAQRLRVTDVPKDGAVVRWVREAGSERPFVRLGDGRLALVDTGSILGFALNEPGRGGGSNHSITHDLGGGSVQSRRVAPQTVSIGSLVLNKVPTDVLTGVAPGTPIILGRGALFPFKITFDPASRLIAFEPTEE
ncbi:MAG TPA: retropepsin-like aspartic protease [Pyrinomonadaceae bacterium]|nr:retropepsin-like aspartic protease [Pyrinomonadaceae bacterium]